MNDEPKPDELGKKILALPFLTGNWVKSDQNVQTKGTEITVAIAATIEHFDFQIHSFSKAIVEASIKVIQDLLPPISQRGDK